MYKTIDSISSQPAFIHMPGNIQSYKKCLGRIANSGPRVKNVKNQRLLDEYMKKILDLRKSFIVAF